jgi:hypothetical protein
MTPMDPVWLNAEAERLFRLYEARLREMMALRVEALEVLEGDKLERWLEDHGRTFAAMREQMLSLYSRFISPAMLITREQAMALGLISPDGELKA